MSDTEMQRLILGKYYERRKEGVISLKEKDFAESISRDDILRISDQLHQKGLVLFSPLDQDGKIVSGVGKITVQGVELWEQGNNSTVMKPMFDNIETINGLIEALDIIQLSAAPPESVAEMFFQWLNHVTQIFDHPNLHQESRLWHDSVDGMAFSDDERLYVSIKIARATLVSILTHTDRKYKNASTYKVLNDLRQSSSRISKDDIRGFVEEGIECAENGLYRAAVVLSWAGAMAVLYDHVQLNRLQEFNNEAQRRNSKWKHAVTTDEFAKMKESEFLEIIESLSIIGKNVKQSLLSDLQTRNGCAHPNSYKIGELKATSVIENLLNNIFLRFYP